MRMNQLEQDYLYLKQMVYFAETALTRLDKAKKYELDPTDDMVIDALAMNIGQIGEQLDSRKLSQELQERYSDLIDWSSIKKFRDKAYHHYGSMDGRVIFNIAVKTLPDLLEKLRFIIRQVEKELAG